MKPVRLTANILFLITKTAALVYLITAGYILLLIILSSVTNSDALPIRIVDDRFTIFFPFTKKPFFLGEYNQLFISTSIMAIVLYGMFLWFLSGVFNAFRKDRLFTQKNVIRLTRFYLLNLIVPVVCVLFMMIIGQDISNVVIIALLHLVAGVFAFFMSVIFKQGLVLQEEQDLTL